MEAQTRREELLKILYLAKAPVTGTDLANRFSVSRQVIVQDIAILRASGEQVLATPQGYVIPNLQRGTVRAVVACCHNRDEIEKELGIVVDLGGKALDVIVEHPLYGDLRGNLMIASRRDLSLFLERIEKTEANPLSALTGGVHLHTIEACDQSVMDEIIESLQSAGFLVD
ncbi:MAG: transcription repressor NadR [Dethiobacter sp.]|jgi:transcriptional regulator of NAD metabolism|nr:transcription repressor NadR [Dethiobacter sp.]